MRNELNLFFAVFVFVDIENFLVIFSCLVKLSLLLVQGCNVVHIIGNFKVHRPIKFLINFQRAQIEGQRLVVFELKVKHVGHVYQVNGDLLIIRAELFLIDVQGSLVILLSQIEFLLCLVHAGNIGRVGGNLWVCFSKLFFIDLQGLKVLGQGFIIQFQLVEQLRQVVDIDQYLRMLGSQRFFN